MTWFIRYLCLYYYHCVDASTGGLLVLIASSSHWHGLLDIYVFYYYHCVYTSTGGLLVLIVSFSQWHGLLDIFIIEIYSSPPSGIGDLSRLWLSYFVLLLPKTFKNSLAFPILSDFEHTWWRLFQRHTVPTTFDAHIFIWMCLIMYCSIQYDFLVV